MYDLNWLLNEFWLFAIFMQYTIIFGSVYIYWVRLHILAFVIWHLYTRDLVLITFPLYFSSPLFKESSFQNHLFLYVNGPIIVHPPLIWAFLTQFLLHFNEILSIQFSNHFYRFPWRVFVLKANRKKRSLWRFSLQRKMLNSVFIRNCSWWHQKILNFKAPKTTDPPRATKRFL